MKYENNNTNEYVTTGHPDLKLITDFPVDSYYIYATNKKSSEEDGYMGAAGTSCIGQEDAFWIIDDIVEGILDNERLSIVDKIIDIVAIKQMVDKILQEASYMHEKGEELVSRIEAAFPDALTLTRAEYPIDEDDEDDEDEEYNIRIPYADLELYFDTAKMLKKRCWDSMKGRKKRH